jgi:hypothetical protein
LTAAAFLYLGGAASNPLGFFVDESSIAFNAYTISVQGMDEHGARMPLYFRSLGDYKSPVFVYALAALFKLFGPSVWLARLLSAGLGLSAALLLGLAAERATGRRRIGVVVALTAMFTPWLFELSRLVFEVAALPLALVLVLVALQRAQARSRWSLLDSLWVALALALVTYAYAIGRLLGPLLAVGLLCFFRSPNRAGVARCWSLYALFLLPLLGFAWRHPGALTARFRLLTYLGSVTPGEAVRTFIDHYLAAFGARGLLVAGDPNIRHHVPGMGSMLAATVLLAAAGLVLVLWRHRGDPWWRFVLWGLLVSPLPGSLTVDRFHALRLAALPVFASVLAVPALAWLCERGRARSVRLAALALAVALTAFQAIVFQQQFAERGPARAEAFDVGFREVFAAAAAQPERPIYLGGDFMEFIYIQAYWYGALRGMRPSDFVRLGPGERPPAGAVMIRSLWSGSTVRITLDRGEAHR